eukprot:CAMPEP_0194271174 /NCGR_PEP_ID=MMETSP0169-20130528/5025_1 /TAXON_ID=218684 /ORGANISM="Corethron pennatum, Strain L29A3" /LENGTH=248 /DNA_ID=CAMNT_0039013463 /DNA_START=51 /DNA_END=797 /DNA_ORIENTATION=-
MTSELENPTNIKLISGDGHTIESSLAAAKLSTLVAETINDNETEAVHIPSVDAAILRMVVDFCEHYIEDPMKEIETPLTSDKMGDLVQEWYADFLDPNKVEEQILVKVILAANSMSIDPLMDLSTSTMASMMMGCPPEDIPANFGCYFNNDPTEEELQEINRNAARRRPRRTARKGRGLPRREPMSRAVYDSRSSSGAAINDEAAGSEPLQTSSNSPCECISSSGGQKGGRRPRGKKKKGGQRGGKKK